MKNNTILYGALAVAALVLIKRKPVSGVGVVRSYPGGYRRYSNLRHISKDPSTGDYIYKTNNGTYRVRPTTGSGVWAIYDLAGNRISTVYNPSEYIENYL